MSVHESLIDEFIEHKPIKGKYVLNFNLLSDEDYQKIIPRKVDLLIRGDDTDYICEFKSNLNSSEIIKAIGQLMIYEQMYKKMSNRKIIKVAVFDGKVLDISEEIKELEKANVQPGSVIFENRLNALKEKWNSIKYLYNIFNTLKIDVYIFIDGCFVKIGDLISRYSEYINKIDNILHIPVDMRLKRLEEKLNEANTLTEVRVVELPDKQFKVIIKPKIGYEEFFEDFTEIEELNFTSMEYPSDIKDVEALVIDILNSIDGYIGRYMKIPLILDFNKVRSRTSPENAAKMFMRLCQKGSALHCSALYNYMVNMLRSLVTLRSVYQIEKTIELFDKIGFEQLAQFLYNLDYPVDVNAPDVADRLPILLSDALRRVLSKYGKVYHDISVVPEAEITRSRELAMNLSEQPSDVWYELIEKPDETPIIEPLRGYAQRNEYIAKAFRKLPVTGIKQHQELHEKLHEEKKETEEKVEKAPPKEAEEEEINGEIDEMIEKIRQYYREIIGESGG